MGRGVAACAISISDAMGNVSTKAFYWGYL
jgi:hypothetical protein